MSRRSLTPSPRRRAGASALLALVLVLGISASSARASQSVESFTTTMSTTQAGGHPDLITSFTLGSPGAPEAARNVVFNAPTGVFGNPRAITQCLPADFALDQCPSDAQAGLITLRANYAGNPNYLLGTAPVFLLVPQEGETARLSFNVPILDIPIAIPVAVRTAGDFGLRFTVKDITQLAPLASARMTLWGFPASSSHAAERFPKGSPGNPTGCPGEEGVACNSKTPTQSGVVNQPLTDNPTVCTGALLTSTLEVETYADPSHNTLAKTTYPEPIDGCEKEVFNPVLQAKSTTNETDSPSGLEVELRSPQFLTFAAAPSQIKAATVTFPEGFTINPDAADGQSECRESAANFDSEGPANCPDSSKIGTFSIGTPALPERLEGDVYIGEPKPGDQYRLFMMASGFGINAKLVGSVRPDPLTGRLTAVFPDLPQAPFEDFRLHLFSGERALMATPTVCTVYTVSAEFFPWNTALAEQTTTQIFSLTSGPHGAGCPGQIRPFHPHLEAGTANPTAGAFSNFSLKLDREDGDQFIGHLGFTMPPGLTASLRGVSYCSDASIQAAARNLGWIERVAPSCPASSKIGASNVAAGPGARPFHATGLVYFAGPFEGAPLSLVVITPALAGPYDYGTVVVRVALHIDPADAHVVANSEPVPKIIGGIPLRIRSIQVNIDRPSFMINPTNCDPFSVDSQGIGDQGTVTDFSSYFQVVNCSRLPFKPKMTVTQLGKRKDTKRNRNPVLRFDLYTREGDANVKSVAVTLPKAFAVDQRHLGNICSKAELASKHCAGRQPIGTVETTTPLLEAPLKGPAYAVSGFGVLPHIVFILGGQVTLLPEAESTSVKGGKLKTTVPVVPDAPIGHFRLNLYGGSQGYLINTGSLCQVQTKTIVEYTAQNGKSRTQSVKPKTACPRGKKAKGRVKRRG